MDLFSTNVAYASFDSFLSNVKTMIINPLITFIFALAVVYFLFGMFKFFTTNEEEAKNEGKQHMLWGIIGITIMMGVFTILNILMRTLNIQGINVETGKVDELK